MRLVTPEWLKPYVIEVKEFAFENEVFPYAVISSDLGSAHNPPPFFTIIKNSFLGINDSYPEHLRTLGLIHEILEARGEQDEYSCYRALCEELRLAEEGGFDMKEYIPFRIRFFEGTIAHYENKEERTEYEDALLVRLGHSHNHLLTLQGMANKTVLPEG